MICLTRTAGDMSVLRNHRFATVPVMSFLEPSFYHAEWDQRPRRGKAR
jgi:hypothetical protein